MMPKMDGYELARALREDPRYQGVPIVMVTSKDARIDTLRGLDAGADAYLTEARRPERARPGAGRLLQKRSKACSSAPAHARPASC